MTLAKAEHSYNRNLQFYSTDDTIVLLFHCKTFIPHATEGNCYKTFLPQYFEGEVCYSQCNIKMMSFGGPVL
jgi:hypothetical protein